MRKFIQLLLNEHNVFSFQLVSCHNYSFYVKWDFCELEIRVRVFTNYTDDIQKLSYHCEHNEIRCCKR